MALEEKLLIVVDPTSDSNPAVDRIVNLSKLGIPGYNPRVTLLFAIDHSSADTSADNPAIYRDDKYLVSLTAPLKAAGLNFSVRISWSREWADSVLFSAQAEGATAIMVSHPGEKTSQTLSDEFWHLIRNASVPVGFIQNSAAPTRKNILVSMDIQDRELDGLNQRIMDAGLSISKLYGAELHLAHAYGSSSSYPDRGRIVALTGLPNENIHLRSGEPDEALADVTRTLKPDMIVIGATRRTGIRAALRGRKISRIFRNIKQDIFVIV